MEWLEREVDKIPPSLLGAPLLLLSKICEEFTGKLKSNLRDGNAGKSLNAELPIFITRLRATVPLYRAEKDEDCVPIT